jgi:hypothetical protein
MGGTVTKKELEDFYEKSAERMLPENAIDRVLHLYEIQARAPVINAVCDAIEGFCDATCGCEGSYFDRGVCYRCGNRIVTQFDILKEDGI